MPQTPRVAHIGVAVTDLDTALAFYRDVLGLVPHPPETADGATIVSLPFGDSEVELLAPQISRIARSPASLKNAVPAFIISATGWPTSTQRWTDAGRPATSWSMQDPRRGAGGRRIAFVHPKSTAGILLELTE